MLPDESSVRAATKLYIANFGTGNYLWPDCLAKSTVATFELEPAYVFSSANDKQGYIAQSLADVRTSSGKTPTRAVASRWFNVCKIIESTFGDLWFHRADEKLWWTISMPWAVEVSRHPSRERSMNPSETVIHLHKPAATWRSTTLKGKTLTWTSLHPKAKAFLTLQSTLREISSENAEYMRAMILGEPLWPWEKLEKWSKYVEVSSPVENAAYRMAMTAWTTTQGSNGQQVLRTLKNKEFRFQTQLELEQYVLSLLKDQEGLCALSGLELQYDGQQSDPQMLCSLDRIDSSGHYERGNLQIVCRFLNRWKSDQDDQEFRRLLNILTETSTV